MAQEKRIGRPTFGDKTMRDRIFVLVNDDTKDKLAECMKLLGKTKSDIVRAGIDRMYDELKERHMSETKQPQGDEVEQNADDAE